MSERWARMLLSAYRLAGSAAFPLVGPYVVWRATKGKEDRNRRRERSGLAGRPRPEGPVIWAHAASVGETVAIIPLIDSILDYGVNVVLTTGTVTSAQVADDRLGDRVIHQFVPLDLKPAISRFLNHWQPDLAIMAESEIWPMTILELGLRRVPQVLVNGRLSDRSFSMWRRWPDLSEALFENMAHVVAQSEVDAERFQALGARPVTVSGNLKVDTNPPPVNEHELHALRRQIGLRPSWAAVSTHDGEETMAAEVHAMLRPHHLGLLSIIVPRHPDRALALAVEFAAMGLKVVLRSSGERVRSDTDILLGDTIGEMGLYLRLADIAFVGRSLTMEGGQNPLEPAMLETAVLSGPNVQNFRDAYERLVEAGAARIVEDRDGLAGEVNFLLGDGRARREMIAAGVATVEDMRGALDKTLRALEPYVRPLIVKSRLRHTGTH
ncbi:MAG: lipid IV(A) 3-deoxy-D-manno-octulosonic acid transferase [Alphaproteobacteria bacterium]|jgi:3-deoxy-D-manno-octulosonic-acid transferase|nr:lipid IV(A) 3-deoxy-D-manno-octulosonic acid transferase [Alphaproteobacteria bacterium]MBU0805922.1 lipid IV(A) 3-deoxy-D-manno-octulosonic acid transferase [Alphaproteobacteria bacterium]MBU0874109.1 lipid IV(A) 3-deoxy-D-manno-octulosonic acid transferase [Alphaproteobacteria bacterium]MBU1402067.1 lipid IV(A) 3-deoxy-D-manno-octulosonic acid transferase [Alphaproteobacteria bacterium]MBU1590712.1 lipid IV(A) 3-deoxy-D-manno-octulosonic acid transferase [Alphaproteobacteria bacterium]